MGLPAGLSSCPKGQDNLGVAAEEPSGFQGVQTSITWTINCGLFWRTWCAESVTTACRESLGKAAAEIPVETVHAMTAEWPERLKACVEA